MTHAQVAVLLGHAQSTPGSEPVESLESVLPAFEALPAGHRTAPISYTEFKRRFDAANAEVWGQRVMLKKDTLEPTAAEFAKQRAVMERHGIADFELSWDAVARRFTLGAKP